MFERMFQWALRYGTRLLFSAAVVILLLSIAQAVNAVSLNARERAGTYFGRLWEGLSIDWTTGLAYLVGGVSGASLPFFCALVIQRIDLRMQARGTAAVTTPPAPSWLARQGARLLLALAIVYFVASVLNAVNWMLQAVTLRQMVFLENLWLGPLWSAGLLLFASLALDRLDRWLATVKPYSG
jgi:hypothetical protein